MTATLEQLAYAHWRAWADFRQYGICGDCGEHCYVGRATRRQPWLCPGCWDQKAVIR